MDCLSKKIITISLMDWNIIIFDQEYIQTMKVIGGLSNHFLHVKSKIKVVNRKWD